MKHILMLENSCHHARRTDFWLQEINVFSNTPDIPNVIIFHSDAIKKYTSVGFVQD